MASSSRIVLLSVLGFLTLLATTATSPTQVGASSSSSSALARRNLLSSSSSSPSGESQSPPYNSPTEGSNPSPDTKMPPVTMPDSPSGQSSGGMQSRKSGKGSCKSWRQKLGQVQKLVSTVGTIAKIFKGNSNNNKNNNNNNNGGGSNNKNGGKYSEMTVMDALMSDSNEGYTSLAREGITSLLNSYAYPDFAYTPDQVRHLFNAAYSSGSPRDVAKQATMFQRANEQLV